MPDLIMFMGQSNMAGDMPRSAQTQTPIATTADSTEAADTVCIPILAVFRERNRGWYQW